MHHFILLCFTSARSAPVHMLFSVATHCKPFHTALFCGSTLCTTSIILYSVATQCATSLCCLLWQHYAPLHFAVFHGNTLCTTSFCLSFCSTLCTTSFCCILWQHTMHHFIRLYFMAYHYASLHMTLFYGNTLCATSYCYILWQHSMPVWPTKDLLCMSSITCTCKKSGLVIVYSCTQGKLKYNLFCAT
jgi:hypothetical protein